ncbi:MAG TPA: protein kinase [Pyrinomonadaceae bacterium]|nr:protein kinase [Pyrinomonadaceae bacterium]
MPGLEQYVGEVLDEKYRLEHLLGQGGMGAVFLATHLGTERYVALKLISPQFMRNNEFVERFKREARAAGRLRHPNVVDVTDFGFATVKAGKVAYLVMEYLDGCTLGDVLSEEKRLPLEWVADILDQVCSAVHEAHQLGIIHRDLKPDNIWLEPNRLGGYRVKVLDFGIAKVGEATAPLPEDDPAATIIDDPPVSGTNAHLESDTLLKAGGDEPLTLGFKARSDGDGVGTLLQNPHTDPFIEHLDEEDGTLLFEQGTHHAGRHTVHADTSAQGSALTRVGAIMGTPLYMSPEQCGGGKVNTRSDIYSLGVIAYQMLAGEPPFEGNTSTVMRAHREQSPPDLHKRDKKIPKRVAAVVMSALSKNPDERPPTAFAFASALRAQSEGIGALYRRAFSLYSEYFPKFVKLSFFAHLPTIVTGGLLLILLASVPFPPKGGIAWKIFIGCAVAILSLLQVVASMAAGAVISGVTAVIITQLTAAPLKPVELREAFEVMRRRWRPFLKTMIMVTWRIFLGLILLFIPGLIMIIRYSLYAPVVLIEGLEKKAAMKRSRELASRSWRTIIIVSIIQFLIPMMVGFFVGKVRVGVDLEAASTFSRISQYVLSQINILVMPLISIVPALLYLKMRQLGGEPLSAVLTQIEEGDKERSEWQQRMRTRLSLHTPVSQRTPTS